MTLTFLFLPFNMFLYKSYSFHTPWACWYFYPRTSQNYFFGSVEAKFSQGNNLDPSWHNQDWVRAPCGTSKEDSVRMGLWRSSGPMPLLREGQLEQIA